MFNKKEWETANRDKELKRKREYYYKNKEKYKINFEKRRGEIQEYRKEYYKKNREKWLGHKNPEYMKNYRKTENGKASKQRSKSKTRAGEREIINTLTAKEWLEILKQHDFKCAYCGKDLFDLFTKPERDHIIPISKGGDNIKENVIPACKSCNAKKGNKIILKKFNRISPNL